ncbi:winged helix-turn-helix transcriptional regulator [Bacillus mesophilum]|uniref:Winged helix-turn-helix transcriptional regulator n=2 Tax=Bacillus mesophilum TaxID=1071718 RepID=A0A7V7UUX6_9BACI|nr:winged helix-turn-helix transcriptional regulator [Bacillus mesophilum]
MEINLEQQKLISSTLRVKIIYLLAENQMTAKQVADEVGKTPGSIHYHIQQLYNGGILEITETKENRGIMEKYYRSKATHFVLKGVELAYVKKGTSRTNLSLTEEEKQAFDDDIDALIMKYIKMTVKEREGRKPYIFEFRVEEMTEEEKE